MSGSGELAGKKIAVIENGLFSTYTMREGLMLHLLKEGCEVHILTHANRFLPQVEKMGLKVTDVGSGNLNPIKVSQYIYMLRKTLKKIKPDVCLTFSIRPAIWGNLITRELKIPTITNITGVGPLFISKNIVYRTARLLYRNALAKTKKVFFQNYDDMDLFIERKFVKKEIAERIPGSGVDYKKFSPIVSGHKHNGHFIFLFIGRLIKDKGIFEYINAAKSIRKKYPNVVFNVMGPFWTQNLKNNTITQKQLQNWIDEGVIDYLGEKKDVRKYIAEADCIVLPSYREGTANTLLEAASMEKPAITSDTTGCREIVDDNVTGFLCKVKDEIDLAKKMEKMLLLHPDERAEMGKNARLKIIKEYDKQIVIQSYVNAIKEAIK
ncbi:MAG: glycosyltransferase family 4 protein [Bacteroidota bacterium]|nr:glycosyltransferase family 4 protein [Bacteroidota bacterium]